MQEAHQTENSMSTQEPIPPTQSKSSFGVPVAIVIAALLIAGSIYMRPGTAPVQPTTPTNTVAQEQVTPEIEVAPVTAEDHIRGNPNAPILLVEYSDYDCPYCKNFHETLARIMDTYGKDGSVAWVYRHFPITQLHPNTAKIAEASECVADLGGTEAFWTFSDLVFGEREINAPTDMTRLSAFAAAAGVNTTAFNTCLENGTHTETIANAVDAAVKAGARGTPHTLVLVAGQRGVINGAQSYEVLSQNIEAILMQLKTAEAEGQE